MNPHICRLDQRSTVRQIFSTDVNLSLSLCSVSVYTLSRCFVDNCFLDGSSYFGSNKLTKFSNEGFSTTESGHIVSAMKCTKAFVTPFCFGSELPYFVDFCLTNSSMFCWDLEVL